MDLQPHNEALGNSTELSRPVAVERVGHSSRSDQNGASSAEVQLARARVSVVILNYCTAHLVIDLLETLESEIDPRYDRVIVVDNQSNDDSPEVIDRLIRQRRWAGWCRLVVSEKNDGFAAGNNVGISAQRADYYWLLNSDTRVQPNSLGVLLKAMRDDETVGMAGPELTWSDGRRQMSAFQFHTPIGEFLASAQLAVLARWMGRFGCATDVESPPKNPDWVSFASVMIRGTALDQVGPLDEGYFMYYEDVDYCFRIRRCGWSILYVPKASVIHLRGGTSPVKELAAKGKRRPLYYYASRTRYFAKHYGRGGLLVANLAWAWGRLLAQPRDWLGIRKPTVCSAEWRDNWTNFFRPLAGRKR